MSMTSPSSRAGLGYGVLLTIGMIVVIGSALGFQYIGGYMPCELCLKERLPYYVGVPVALLALLAAVPKAPPVLVRGLLALAALLMIVGAGLATYHAGVEWHFWPGPSSCTGFGDPGGSDASTLLSDLNTVKPPSCDQAAGRFLGISFAGWNVVASVVLAAVALKAAFGRPGK